MFVGKIKVGCLLDKVQIIFILFYFIFLMLILFFLVVF